MEQNHQHNHHGHGHGHAPADFSRAFALGTALNLAFVLVEGGNDPFLHQVAEDLRHDFTIHHTTLQRETEEKKEICQINNKSQGCWLARQGSDAPRRHSTLKQCPDPVRCIKTLSLRKEHQDKENT